MAVMAWNSETALPGRPVPPENWHLTLRFLGDLESVQLERFLGALEEEDLGEAFQVRLSGVGAFPKPGRAAVLWLGVTTGADRLSEIAEACEEAAVTAGLPVEDRPFRPHLTLSRIRPPQDVRGLVDSPPPPAVSFAADAVTVFRSHLGGVPRYEEIDRIPL